MKYGGGCYSSSGGFSALERELSQPVLGALTLYEPMSAMFRLSGGEKRDPLIEEWLNKTDVLTAVARTWFRMMRACGEDVLELMHDGHPVVCVDDAPFAYVDVFRSHTNVGFFYGAHLDDPAGLLEGGGKNMRHVKLKSGREPDSVALGNLIHASYLDVKIRLRAE